LADVYINMTRGQDALMMDLGGDAEGDNGTAAGIDLSRFKLTVLTANETETAAHHKVLSEINKACESGSIWERAPT